MNVKRCHYCGDLCKHISEQYPGDYVYYCDRCYRLELDEDYAALYELQMAYWEEQINGTL